MFDAPSDSLPSAPPPIDARTVRSWFADPIAVDHYARAAASLGLWRSEEMVFLQVFRPEQRLVDIGCGAGRIALALASRGFGRIMGLDYCPPLLAEARRLADAAGLAVDFIEGDATALALPDAGFEGAIFGFNGLMQIPGRENRRTALREIRRILVPGGHFVFTTHDRDTGVGRIQWQEERVLWRRGEQDPGLREFGDRIIVNPEGRIFMHLPDRTEILEDLEACGWQHENDHLRAELANESAQVRDFSDECRFWIVRRG